MSPQDTLDTLSLRLYGMRMTDAIALKRCVKCRRAVGPEYMSDVDRMEWNLSALCPECYRIVMPEEDGA